MRCDDSLKRKKEDHLENSTSRFLALLSSTPKVPLGNLNKGGGTVSAYLSEVPCALRCFIIMISLIMMCLDTPQISTQ